MREFLFLNLIIIIHFYFYEIISTTEIKENDKNDENKYINSDKGYITLPFTLTKSNIPISKIKIGQPEKK